VGHADSVKPMETEYGGSPVDGGTIPALIFHDVLTAYESMKKSAGPDDHSIPPEGTTTSVPTTSTTVAPTTTVPATTTATTAAPAPSTDTAPAPTDQSATPPSSSSGTESGGSPPVSSGGTGG
jgi:hypothetical protein